MCSGAVGWGLRRLHARGSMPIPVRLSSLARGWTGVHHVGVWRGAAEACGQRPPCHPVFSTSGKEQAVLLHHLGLLELGVLNIVHITTDRINQNHIHYIWLCVNIYIYNTDVYISNFISNFIT